MKMPKTLIVSSIVFVLFLISFALAQEAPENEDYDTCINDCLKTYEMRGCVPGTDPFCQEQISTGCQLICGETATAVLNTDYPVKIGQSVTITDYDNMEITLGD